MTENAAMIQHRPHQRLPGADIGWLKARHHVAVGGKADPVHTPVGPLIVWNDDEFAPGRGFGMHPHADMEIITYVRGGAVTHRDTLDNEEVIAAGDVQVMSAGSGMRHSEHNLGAEPLKLYQIWLQPNVRGGAPAYGTRKFPKADRSGGFVTLASGFDGDGGDSGVLPLRADARLLGATLKAGATIEQPLAAGRRAYLVVALGAVVVNGKGLDTGDGAAIDSEAVLRISALQDSELVMVEVA